MKRYVQAMLLLLSMQFINFMIFIWLSKNAGTSYSRILEFTFLFLIVADFILLKNLYKNSQLSKIKNQLEMANEQKLMESSYEIKMKEWTEEIGHTRQVLKNLLLEVNMQLSTSPTNANSVFPILDQINCNMFKAKTIYFCDHILTNTILADKYKIALQYDIDFSVQTAVPSTLNITDSEICSIWCNLLDNAINACKKIATPEKRWIRVASIIQNGYLYIKIENSIDKHTDVVKNRSKRDNGIDHGYGLSIIRELAHKNDGELILKQEAERYVSILTISSGNCA